MKKFAKISAVLAAMVLALAFFAACSEDDDDDDSGRSGGKEVVAKFASSENQTIFFYEDETFKVVEGKAESARAIFVETVVMEGEYEGNPERPGTITLTVKKCTLEGYDKADTTITVTVGSDNAQLSFDKYFKSFSRLEEDFEDETFYDLTEEQRSNLIGTWTATIEEEEDEVFDENHGEFQHLSEKYNWSGTFHSYAKFTLEMTIDKNGNDTSFIKKGSYAIDEYRFDKALTDEQAKELEEWIHSTEEIDYLSVEPVTSKDKKTVKVTITFTEDHEADDDEEIGSESKVLKVNGTPMLVDVTYYRDEDHGEEWEEYAILKINAKGNKIQVFNIEDWEYVDSGNKDAGIKTEKPIELSFTFKK